VVNSVFSRNSATTEGSDIHYQHTRPLDIIHGTFVDFAGTNQRSIVIYTATVEITNTIVSSYLIGIHNQSGVVTLTNNLYFNNVRHWFGDLANIFTSGNLFGDPTFVDGAMDDFRLVVGSPAIDSGINAGITVDILGVARPQDGGFDRGAYEGRFTPTAVTLTTLAARTTTPFWPWTTIVILFIFVSFIWRKVNQSKTSATFPGTLRKPSQ
ncbi:MAG: hypothetical protein GY796_01855, partial [Chloroflexi bacterium]|nr:hypothetical protein [Chloroflexota bacterium]